MQKLATETNKRKREREGEKMSRVVEKMMHVVS